MADNEPQKAKTLGKGLLCLVGAAIGLWIHIPRASTAFQMAIGTLGSGSAVITKWTSQDHGDYLASYEFQVEGKSYTGQCYFDGDVGEGETTRVEYVASNPSANCLAGGYKLTVFPLLFSFGMLIAGLAYLGFGLFV